MNAESPGLQSIFNFVHSASITLQEKNGNQQMRKTPVKNIIIFKFIHRIKK